MDERFRRVEQIEQPVRMLLGVFSAKGVLPLEFKPAQSVGDLVLNTWTSWSVKRRTKPPSADSQGGWLATP
jgi:hypothetical protein